MLHGMAKSAGMGNPAERIAVAICSISPQACIEVFGDGVQLTRPLAYFAVMQVLLPLVQCGWIVSEGEREGGRGMFRQKLSLGSHFPAR